MLSEIIFAALFAAATSTGLPLNTAVNIEASAAAPPDAIPWAPPGLGSASAGAASFGSANALSSDGGLIGCTKTCVAPSA